MTQNVNGTQGRGHIFSLFDPTTLARMPRRFGRSETWCQGEVYARAEIGIIDVGESLCRDSIFSRGRSVLSKENNHPGMSVAKEPTSSGS